MMGLATRHVKTEHTGAKNGGSGHWGGTEMAKTAARKARRINAGHELQEYEDMVREEFEELLAIQQHDQEEEEWDWWEEANLPWYRCDDGLWL